MSSTAYNDALNRIFDKNKEIFEVFDELMESIQNVKDIVEGSEEVAYEIQDIPLETMILTDAVNKKIQTLEYKAKKVGNVMNRMLSSIDEGNMIIDETMRDIKNNSVDEDEINNNLYTISKKIEKIAQYGKRINR